MVASAATSFVGLGMYTPAEAAMYTRLTSRTVSRWIHGDAGGSAAVRAQIPNDEKTVTFLDFVQSLAIRAIRQQRTGKRAVSLQKIREAVEFAGDKGVDYPFARKHTTYLFDGDVFIDAPELGLTQASGKLRGQQAIEKVVEPYLEDLVFNADGVAEQYVAAEGPDGIRIVMRPGFHFGEPFVEPCGLTARILWEACHSEGGVDPAARAYGVKPEEVRLAYRYIDSIRPASAA
jgi:uncharacterized protein (DUF433 family)